MGSVGGVVNRVLLIDDDDRMTGLLSDYLAGHAFEVSVARDGREGLSRATHEAWDVIVLDVMLPQLDGIECLRELRKSSQVPVIMLTARGDDTDRIVGLEMGADDYLAKPFNPRELVARIKGILRRSARPVQAEDTSGIIRLASFSLDVNRRSLIVNGESTPLTTVEFELLHTLIKHAGRVLNREQLLDMVRGQDYAALDRTIDVHISRLRQKIEEDPRNPRYIKTVWGVGYMFVRER